MTSTRTNQEECPAARVWVPAESLGQAESRRLECREEYGVPEAAWAKWLPADDSDPDLEAACLECAARGWAQAAQEANGERRDQGPDACLAGAGLVAPAADSEAAWDSRACL